MPHLIPLVGPPKLSLELGISCNKPLGYEVLFSNDPLSREAKIGALCSALGRLVTSCDPAQVELTEKINVRFARDTRGAPNDFAFQTNGECGIMELLYNSSTELLGQFCVWNSARVAQLRNAMATHMPDMQDDIATRVARLKGHGLLPRVAERLFSATIRKIVAKEMFGALDSFEGGIMDGSSSPAGIFITHLFDGGYAIGQPTDRFWHVGFHETGHRVLRPRRARRSRFSDMPLVEEALLEHYTTVSDEPTAIAPSCMLATAKVGNYYQKIRELFGYAFTLRNSPIGMDMAGEAFAGDENSAVLATFKSRLVNNFAILFPEHGAKALEIFSAEYFSTPPVFARICAARWADLAAVRAA
jgi:hypothetical protein